MPTHRTPEQWEEGAKKSVHINGDVAMRTIAILEVLGELLGQGQLTPAQIDCLSAGRGDLGPLRAVLPYCRKKIEDALGGSDAGGGSAGDREPRRPPPSPQSAGATAEPSER